MSPKAGRCDAEVTVRRRRLKDGDATRKGVELVERSMVHADGELERWQRELRPSDDTGELLPVCTDHLSADVWKPLAAPLVDHGPAV